MPAIPFDITSNWFLTLIILVGAFFLNRTIHLVLSKTFKDRDVARGALSVASNAVWVFAAILLLNTWMEQLRNLWISLAALGAGLVIVNKEIVMNVAGHFVRMASGGLATGDIIRIGDVTGKVVSYDLMSTKLLSMSPAGVFTGQIVQVPNNMMLTHALHQISFAGRYCVETLRIPLSIKEPVNQHIAILKAAACQVTEPHKEAALQHFRRLERDVMVSMPGVEPEVFIEPIDEKRIDLVLRIALPGNSRTTLSQDVLRLYYANLQNKDGE